MADTTPASFDPKPRSLGPVYDMIAGAAILAGQVVGFHGTGVDYTVHPIVASTTSAPIGVALYSQATTGGHVAVAGIGSMIKVCEGKGAALDAGDFVQECSVAGCVCTGSLTSSALWQVGVTVQDIGANGTGYAIINPVYVGKGA